MKKRCVHLPTRLHACLPLIALHLQPAARGAALSGVADEVPEEEVVLPMDVSQSDGMRKQLQVRCTLQSRLVARIVVLGIFFIDCCNARCCCVKVSPLLDHLHGPREERRRRLSRAHQEHVCRSEGSTALPFLVNLTVLFFFSEPRELGGQLPPSEV